MFRNEGVALFGWIRNIDSQYRSTILQRAGDSDPDFPGHTTCTVFALFRQEFAPLWACFPFRAPINWDVPDSNRTIQTGRAR
ncbi:MAG TPA: hypothetical protein DEB39_04700 [Planctomycetaceae bacterium]|nr:hypothetical protein [Planctomycetaceae bacterium]